MTSAFLVHVSDGFLSRAFTVIVIRCDNLIAMTIGMAYLPPNILLFSFIDYSVYFHSHFALVPARFRCFSLSLFTFSCIVPLCKSFLPFGSVSWFFSPCASCFEIAGGNIITSCYMSVVQKCALLKLKRAVCLFFFHWMVMMFFMMVAFES